MRLCLIVLLLAAPALLFASGEGTVGGTVAVITEPGEQFNRALPKAVVIAALRGKEFRIPANENGDFLATLPQGKYELIRVTDENSCDVRLVSKQVRVFTVKNKKHTRFDVLVEEQKK